MRNDIHQLLSFTRRKKVVVVKNTFIGWKGSPEPILDELRLRDFVLCVGNLRPEKGHARLLELYKESALSVPLVLIGDGPCRPAIEAHIEVFGLRDRVLLAGTVANPTDYFKFALGVVVPSHYEGNPNVVAEAEAFCLPILAFNDCETMLELQADGAAVEVIDPSDVEGFVRLVDSWCVAAHASHPNSGSSKSLSNRAKGNGYLELIEAL
jgi:glycosyltransferase involved in cell wall biosynthesis